MGVVGTPPVCHFCLVGTIVSRRCTWVQQHLSSSMVVARLQNHFVQLITSLEVQRVTGATISMIRPPNNAETVSRQHTSSGGRRGAQKNIGGGELHPLRSERPIGSW
jgi:hypothetical protein